MRSYRKAAPVRQHRNGQKPRTKSTKARTIILLAAAKFFNWLVGEIGLSLLAVFGLPPLLGLAPWRPGPVALGLALLALGAWAEVSE